MNGNPYDFQSYYTQEKAFDISSLSGPITEVSLSFYQVPETFADDCGNQLPHLDNFGNELLSNLFLKNAYVTLGYDVSDFDKEMIQIYTLEPTSYSSEDLEPKKVQLRWIHRQDDGSFKSISLSDDLDCEIRWYKYELGCASADQYSDVYWKYLSKQKKDKDNWTYEICDDELEDYITQDGINIYTLGFFYSWMLPSSKRATEKIKAILIYQGEVYRSNTITFTNNEEISNTEILDSLYGLNIHCEDGTYGNYRLYKLGGGLLDNAQAYIPRKLKPMFRSIENGVEVEPTEVIEFDSITWIIPKVNTMIRVESADLAGDLQEDGKHYAENEESYFITRTSGNGNLATNIQTYYIKNYYNQNYSNNTIQCRIVKGDNVLVATKELTFGSAGSSGTDCTFILDFDNGVTAMTDGETEAVAVTARLYDYENNEVNISDRTIEWNWKTDNHLFEIVNQTTNKTPTCELKFTDSMTISNSNYSILQATLTNWGDYALTAYLPIPLRSDSKYTMISGTTQIIYNSDGCLTDYFKNPFQIWGNKEEPVLDKEGKETGETTQTFGQIDGVTWNIENAAAVDEKAYTPKIIEQKDKDGKVIAQYLQPLSFYVEGACENISVIAKIDNQVVWRQPILIMLNKYPAAMLNDWDGSLIINEDEGNIMSPRLVAGKKNGDNSFSGVVLGDCKALKEQVDGSLDVIGLFGYSEGEQSFGFMEDGTAFIGKSGTGRIEFDGEKGLIESSGYKKGKIAGMQIDLKDKTIVADQFITDPDGNISDGETISVFSLSTTDPFLKIIDPVQREKYNSTTGVLKEGTAENVTLMQVGGSTNYFLQSRDFWKGTTARNPKGLKLDLTKGQIIASDGIFGGDIQIYSSLNNERRIKLDTVLSDLDDATAKAQSAADAAADAAAEAKESIAALKTYFNIYEGNLNQNVLDMNTAKYTRADTLEGNCPQRSHVQLGNSVIIEAEAKKRELTNEMVNVTENNSYTGEIIIAGKSLSFYYNNSCKFYKNGAEVDIGGGTATAVFG